MIQSDKDKEFMQMAASTRRIYKAIIAFVLFISIFMAKAYGTNDMNIIPLSSPIYGYMDDLYTLEGHAAPQGARPWTNADLRQQLDRITPTSEAARNLYKEIESFLHDNDNDRISGSWNISIEPAMTVHSNDSKFDESGKWVSQALNNKLIKGEVGFYAKNYFAGKFGLSVGFRDSANARGYQAEDGSYYFQDSAAEDRFSSIFSTNIPFISAGGIDTDVTDNSFISLGTPYISIALGRGAVSWGNGAMGNLILGNTLPYHDYVSISASNNTWFDYTMLISFFTHPQNYYQNFTDEIHGIQLFIGHRFEFRMFSDKLRFTMNEAIMYHSPDNTIDFRIFNPLLILHGLFIPANANSLASFELEYSPIKQLQLYLSMALDDLSVGDEPKAPETKTVSGFLCTSQSYEKKKDELKDINQVQMPEILKEINFARELGDLRENSEYQYAKDHKRELERRISELNNDLSTVRIMTMADVIPGLIGFGTKVTLHDNLENKDIVYTFMGRWESEPEKGIIDFNAPLGQQLVNHKEGEDVKFSINGRDYDLTVKSIEPVEF